MSGCKRRWTRVPQPQGQVVPALFPSAVDALIPCQAVLDALAASVVLWSPRPYPEQAFPCLALSLFFFFAANMRTKKE